MDQNSVLHACTVIKIAKKGCKIPLNLVAFALCKSR